VEVLVEIELEVFHPHGSVHMPGREDQATP
jgi:hypothetical protein